MCACLDIWEAIQRLKIRWKEHQDALDKGVMEKSAISDNAWENHAPPNPLGGVYSAGQCQRTRAVG